MKGFVIGFALALTLALGVAVADGPSGTPEPPNCDVITPNPPASPCAITSGVTLNCDCSRLWVRPLVFNDANCDGVADVKDVLYLLERQAGLRGVGYCQDEFFQGGSNFAVLVHP